MRGGADYTETLAILADDLESCTDFQDRWSRFTGLTGALGADQVNYGLFDTFSFRRDEAPVNFISTMSADWISYYGERRFDLHDPHVIEARAGKRTHYRWREDWTERLSDDHLRDVANQTSEAGLRAQIHVVLPDPLGISGSIGGITIGSSLRPDEYFASVGDQGQMLVAAAILFHQQTIGEMRRQQVGAQALSTRERDCLTYAALGLRTTRIAERLGVSDVTAELHLRNARNKLKTKTTAQAVARAIIFGDVRI